MTSPAPLTLSLRSISKRFGGVAALTDVSFDLASGEIVGLVGENGSGKSTLIKIITGYHAPEPGAEGEIWGDPIAFPIIAPMKRGIATIHQDLGLIDDLTVLENVGVSSGYGTRGVRPVNWSRQRRECIAEMKRSGIKLDPDAMVGNLTPVERAAVAILRASWELRGRKQGGGEIFILDEPTAYLTNVEVQQLMGLMRSVAAKGSGVIFVSHHLREITAVCDRVVVLRDGRVVANVPNRDLTVTDLIGHMLGRELTSFYPRRVKPPMNPEIALHVTGLTGRVVADLSFSLNKREIVGVTGLAGMGQEELPYLISGVRRPKQGLVINGDGVTVGASPRNARRAGIVLVPANRSRDGVWPAATAGENVSLPVLGRFYTKGWLDRRREATSCKEVMTRFRVVPAEPRVRVKAFSGGNQQKIVLAKWLQESPAVLLLDEPTMGVDAGARREILAIVKQVAEAGAGVMVFSSDLEQLVNVCTRVLVLWHGRLIASVDAAAVNEDSLLALCQGRQ